jgi:excisionase family DNA binding protein
MQLYTVKEVAALLKVSPRTVARLVIRQQLRAVHVGQRLRIRAEHLGAYLNEAEHEPEHQRNCGCFLWL